MKPSAHSVHPCDCRAACGFQSYFTFHVILRTAWEVDNAALLSPSASEETNTQKVQLSDRAREWNLSEWTEDGPCLQIHVLLLALSLRSELHQTTGPLFAWLLNGTRNIHIMETWGGTGTRCTHSQDGAKHRQSTHMNFLFLIFLPRTHILVLTPGW